MEQIDIDTVVLPRWYEPNPGRARDLAFIVFTGEGAGTRVNRITNGRWVMSAFGTASSAALSSADTVYSVHAALSPVGADDERRRRDRRRRAPGDGDRVRRRRRSGMRLAATASRSRRTRGRCCTTSCRRPRASGRAPPLGAAVHRLRHAARAVAARAAALQAGARARVLRGHRGAARSSSTSAAPSSGCDRPAAAGQRRGRARRLRRRRSASCVLGRDGFATPMRHR